MNRKYEGLPITENYTVWTIGLSREELMIILDGIASHTINRAKKKLSKIRAEKYKARNKKPTL